MRIVVLPEAADEFEDAADYYDEQQAGLGQRYRPRTPEAGVLDWETAQPQPTRRSTE